MIQPKLHQVNKILEQESSPWVNSMVANPERFQTMFLRVNNDIKIVLILAARITNKSTSSLMIIKPPRSREHLNHCKSLYLC